MFGRKKHLKDRVRVLENKDKVKQINKEFKGIGHVTYYPNSPEPFYVEVNGDLRVLTKLSGVSLYLKGARAATRIYS